MALTPIVVQLVTLPNVAEVRLENLEYFLPILNNRCQKRLSMLRIIFTLLFITLAMHSGSQTATSGRWISTINAPIDFYEVDGLRYF